MVSRIAKILENKEDEILSQWLAAQTQRLTGAERSRVSPAELRTILHDFVLALKQGLQAGVEPNLELQAWSSMRDMLTNLSRQRAAQGFTPSETARFVFSFKTVLQQAIRDAYQDDPQGFLEEIAASTELLDTLGLFTIGEYQKSRESVILRQQQELLDLSTPVVELWSGIVALPLIGTLDSARTQIVMQNLLEAIVAREADIAIIDITGVPTVDTLVAQHLLKTVAAARLMGADCIISGIRPQIAQTIIHLGVDLGAVITKANMADAFRLALRKKNLCVASA